jgi:hypothetical protein
VNSRNDEAEFRPVFAKAGRKGLSSADDLLRRCDEKDGRRRFPVHDLLGVRVIVRSLNEVSALRRVVEDLRASRGRAPPTRSQHTHAEAYVPDEANGDPRYAVIRILQRALAEQLNAADLLMAKLEDAADAVRDSIGPPEPAYGGVGLAEAAGRFTPLP